MAEKEPSDSALEDAKQALKAPIRMPDGSMIHPGKGTPQEGIISPLLANIVLNELDHWIESQWQTNPVTEKYTIRRNRNGGEMRSDGYAAMKKTRLKEMFIVRYADGFRIFCRTKTDAVKTKTAVTQWLSERLKLEVPPEKTRIVHVKRRYSEFLGFKIKVHPKGKKQVVKSHICDKQMKRLRQKLTEQAKTIARPVNGRKELDEVKLYNSMVMGIQNYYRIAAHISADCSSLNRTAMTILTNRLRTQIGSRLAKEFIRACFASSKTPSGGSFAVMRLCAKQYATGILFTVRSKIADRRLHSPPRVLRTH